MLSLELLPFLSYLGTTKRGLILFPLLYPPPPPYPLTPPPTQILVSHTKIMKHCIILIEKARENSIIYSKLSLFHAGDKTVTQNDFYHFVFSLVLDFPIKTDITTNIACLSLIRHKRIHHKEFLAMTKIDKNCTTNKGWKFNLCQNFRTSTQAKTVITTNVQYFSEHVILQFKVLVTCTVQFVAFTFHISNIQVIRAKYAKYRGRVPPLGKLLFSRWDG